MTGVAIFVVFLALMLLGVPIGSALMLGGAVGIGFAELGWLSIPNNFYSGIAKYPLLALPMFVLVGTLFERSGVAARLVDFAVAIVGRGRGMLPLVAIAVAMFMGGISGSGPATAAAVGAVMLVSMARAGYPPTYSASVIGAGATKRLNAVKWSVAERMVWAWIMTIPICGCIGFVLTRTLRHFGL